ncbi:MAG: hypothetical protein JW720_02275, partial [Sedimentisphaerales bacterium]|nr:hypothetical protein [Sedimentisphaerales bacterium]
AFTDIRLFLIANMSLAPTKLSSLFLGPVKPCQLLHAARHGTPGIHASSPNFRAGTRKLKAFLEHLLRQKSWTCNTFAEHTDNRTDQWPDGKKNAMSPA